MAVRNHPRIQAAQLEASAASEQANQARAAFLPSVTWNSVGSRPNTIHGGERRQYQPVEPVLTHRERHQHQPERIRFRAYFHRCPRGKIARFGAGADCRGVTGTSDSASAAGLLSGAARVGGPGRHREDRRVATPSSSDRYRPSRRVICVRRSMSGSPSPCRKELALLEAENMQLSSMVDLAAAIGTTNDTPYRLQDKPMPAALAPASISWFARRSTNGPI